MRECKNCGAKYNQVVHNQRYCSPACKQAVKNARRAKASHRVGAEMRRPSLSDVSFNSIFTTPPEGHAEYLQREVNRLTRENDKLKSQKYEQVRAVYEGLRDGLKHLQLDPIKAPKIKQAPGEEEVAAIIAADWQAGKVTPSYNTAVLEDRIETYVDKVIQMTEIQRSDHPVNRARLWFLGDMGEGENIFSGQANLIESSSFAQFIVDLPRIGGNMIRRLLEKFETLHFVGVPGNHGRLGTKELAYNKETNFDRIFYKVLEYIFADEPRITFQITEGHGELGFYAVDTVGNLGTLLMHGNQYPSIQGFAAMKARTLGYRDAIEEPFQQVWIGHWHQVMKQVFGKAVFHISGSPESSNTFAQEVLAAISKPSQPLQFIHPRKGIVTWEADIWLD